jgi:thioredoxin-related protein
LSEKLSKYLINILKYVVEEKWMLSIDTADYIKEIEKKVNWLDFSK